MNVQTAQLVAAAANAPQDGRKPFLMSKRKAKMNTTNDGVEPWNKQKTSFERIDQNYSPMKLPPDVEDSDDEGPREI